MKVLKHNRIRNPDKWTIGKVGTCDDCKTKVRIGRFDVGEMYSRNSPKDRRVNYTIVTFKCPKCPNGLISLCKTDTHKEERNVK